MNKITLKGELKNIEYSHTIGDIEYNKANLLVIRDDGKEDLLSLRFKKFSNRYQEGSQIELIGNVRSYSEKLDDGKNKVSIYVFTYFDLPDEILEKPNNVLIDGRICKMEELRKTTSGKDNVHFILANNIISQDGNQKLNNYIPCVAWGKLARECAKLSVSSKISLTGELHSRIYKKILENDEMEFRTAHEIIVKGFSIED